MQYQKCVYIYILEYYHYYYQQRLILALKSYDPPSAP